AMAEYHAQTDGVAFMQLYWDTDAGPWDEQVGPSDAAPLPAEWGEGLDMDDGGVGDETVAAVPAMRRAPMGDLRTRVLRTEDVRVASNATAAARPDYWVLKTRGSQAEAARRAGGEVAEEFGAASGTDEDDQLSGMGTVGMEIRGQDELSRNLPTVDMHTVFCEPNEYLPNGLQLVVVGDVVAYANDLLFGVVPMVRITDGSTDPSFFPAAIMEGWIDHQMRVNALLSKWIESIRVNSGGRFIVKPGTMSTETLIGGLISALEVRATGSISDAIMPVSGFSVGSDVKDLLEFEIRAFEQKSGWNDTSRGSVGSNTSGRAILAIREQLERVFSPPVAAAAKAMTDWAKVCLYGMRWGYDAPRNIGVFGTSRPDLARVVSGSDFDGICDVEIDKETLMPMPRALKLFLLDQMYERGQMTPEEYRRRMPFAYTRNLQSPDDDHESRAKRIADGILRGAPVPAMRWQDHEAIHQSVLHREILLDGSLDQQLIQIANQRWMELAQQAAMKMGSAPPPAPGGGGAATDTPPQGPSLDPAEQPFLATDPGIATGPVEELADAGDIGGGGGVGYDFTQQV